MGWDLLAVFGVVAAAAGVMAWWSIRLGDRVEDIS